MKPWFDSIADLAGGDPFRGLNPGLRDAGRAILEAADNLPECVDLILFDLETPVATRFVAMPVYHRHDQDCGRA